eukprot:12118147-Karenia_brevis.AAC.1
MPMRPGFGIPEEILERPPEDDPEFDIYMSEFIEVTGKLEKIRTPWLARVPMDDPMKADEGQYRSTEKVILEDLVKRNASSRLTKMAHILPQRLSTVPDVT